MEDQYGLADLRHYAGGGRSFFPAAYPPPLFQPSTRSSAADGHPYYALNFGSSDHSINAAPAMAAGGLGGFSTESGGGGGDGGGAGRWPRQETLTLLEIRSKLDPKFKEANQKGPLWDEVSRIMSEEYGYQRNGKKCREKFENLYKYYKKTKGGKAGRQDGKHYRFFRQLEALYGDQTTNNNNNNSSASVSDQQTNFVVENSPYEFNFPNHSNNNNNNNPTNYNHQESFSSLISISNSSGFDTLVSSDDDDESGNENPKRKKRGSLKAKIKETIDSQMKRMMEKQEAWMEKMTRTIEENEQERMSREEQWRRQDAERIEREQKMWAGEKAWIEARDAALMDAFRKMVTGKETSVDRNNREEDQAVLQVQENWDCVSDYLIKKRKESGATYHDHESSIIGGEQQGIINDLNNGINDSCFRYFNGDGYGRIMN